MSENLKNIEGMKSDLENFTSIFNQALKIYKDRYPEFAAMWRRFPIQDLYLYSMIKMRRSMEFYNQGNKVKAMEDYLDALNILLFVGAMLSKDDKKTR